MKKIAISLATVIGFTSALFSQNAGIGSNPTANRLEIVSTVIAPGVASMLGVNNGSTGTAVVGSSSAANTRGIVGLSNNGYGVQGYTNDNIGVSALSLSGIALSASSSTGFALQINGNLKFAGGNTNPSKGAVLSSDALGEATWKKSNIAFLGIGTLQTNFADGVFMKVEFVTESYDLQNNFEDYNGTVSTNSSVFTAPVAGVYHFSSNLAFTETMSNNIFYFDYGDIKLVKNGVSVGVYRGHPFRTYLGNSNVDLAIVADCHLAAGDKVWIEALQKNGTTAEALNTGNTSARFSGHLVLAD